MWKHWTESVKCLRQPEEGRLNLAGQHQGGAQPSLAPVSRSAT